MAVTAYLYGKAQAAIMNKEVDWTTDTIKVALTTSAHIPDPTDDYFNDITNEITGTGYTAGGATLATCTATYTAATKTLALDAADTAWTGATFTAHYAHIYDAQSGAAATSPLLVYVDFGSNVSVAGGTLTLSWNAAGIITLTAS